MKFDKPTFSASGDYDARKPFDFQGEHIARGARFDWRRLGVGARKLRQLWDNGFIVPAGSLPTLPAADPVPPAADNSDPGDEATSSNDGGGAQAGSSEPSAEDKAKAEAEAKAKRVEAGKKAAAARAAKKAGGASAPNAQAPEGGSDPAPPGA